MVCFKNLVDNKGILAGLDNVKNLIRLCDEFLIHFILSEVVDGEAE